MTLRNKGIPALIVTCAFAMFAVAAIPTHAKAASYNNMGGKVALCADPVACLGGYYYGDGFYGVGVDLGGIDLGYHYRNPTRYSHPRSGYRNTPRYPTLRYTNTVYRSPRYTYDRFKTDYVQAQNQWDAEMRYWQQFSL